VTLDADVFQHLRRLGDLIGDNPQLCLREAADSHRERSEGLTVQSHAEALTLEPSCHDMRQIDIADRGETDVFVIHEPIMPSLGG